jgi:putative photosynthetic complex assembly protein
MLLGAAALVGFTLLGATTARLTGYGAAQRPAAAEIANRSLRFEDRPGGVIEVFDAASGRQIDQFGPGEQGFVRGVMRALVRERRKNEVAGQSSFRLTRWADGRLTIEDAATARRIELVSFGHTNAEVFARLLVAAGAAK